jgi:hypothetical protein
VTSTREHFEELTNGEYIAFQTIEQIDIKSGRSEKLTSLIGLLAGYGMIHDKHDKAQADCKANLQEKINQLDSKIQAQLQKAKERREAAERQAQAKFRCSRQKQRPLRPRPRKRANQPFEGPVAKREVKRPPF